MNLHAVLVAFLCLVGAGTMRLQAAGNAVAETQAPPDDIQVESLNPAFLFDYDLETGEVNVTNGVRVIYRDTTLTARRLHLESATGEALAEGAVTLEHRSQIWTGDRLRYNFRTGDLEAEDFRLGVPPLFVGGQVAMTLEPIDGHRVFAATNAFLTTDDLAQPGFRIRAHSLRIEEGRRVVARSATLYVGETPVFWFPVYTRRLGSHPTRWVLTPGYRTSYGAYLRAAYQFDIGEQVHGALHMDPYSRRGLGVGPSIQYDLGTIGAGDLDAYWIADQAPEDDPLTGRPPDTQRERIRFIHRATLRPGLTATAVVRQQSDPWVVRDFFEDEYRQNPRPSTFFEVQQVWPDFTLNALTRAQVNDFFETVERLPDVRLSAYRQELGESGIYYEGEDSVGWFQHRFMEGSLTNDYSAFRADSFHQLLYPQTFFGWLNVTPRVGGRLTYYGDTQGTGWEDLDAKTRGVFNTGVEVSFKAYRLWRNARSQFWDVDGLRHIIEPSVNYAFTPEPNVRPLELPQFDTELPSLRLLPVGYPEYNSIDSIDSQNVLRLGMRNKLQTKRAGQVDDLLDWVVMADWRLDPRHGQRTFNDVYSEADFRPRRWITVNSEVRIDPNDAILRESETAVVLKPGRDWSLGIAHRYTHDDPFLGRGGNLLGTRLYLRFSENWGFRTSHYYEIRDHLLQEQYYTVYRDLRSLTAALTFRIRKHLDRADDFAVALTISLKAFPRFRTGEDAERPALLIGG